MTRVMRLHGRADRQQGFALLTVLLIVALVALLSSQLVFSQHLSLQRGTYMLHQSQSLAVAWGLEGWVKRGLLEDAKNNQTDHPGELWAQPLIKVPFEGGEISGQLFDLQARININNVQDSDEIKRKRWQRLLERWRELLELPNPIADTVTDWVDSDEEPLPLGTESDVYLLKQPPYRTANQPLVVLDELKMLQGFEGLTAAQWQAVQTSATALPTVTAINVNTADKTVLMALADWMTEGVAQAWLQQRQQQPADQVAVFTAFLAQQTGKTQAEIDADVPDWMLSVNSEYFLLLGEIAFGDSDQQVAAIFERTAQNKVNLVQRWLSAAPAE
ncbi:type II secretion system minor pseudopilin GspK [Thiomicrorhabdus cannonii]|uniref:type II secretion system minor pseudopilin GspK n=1 Tax=Thiomicrorhabdus cannonii TaxID=2748011 RepID=UPI0015BE7D64|nr:type II secretion system minor pseudopilin GspK [Thiomicrorhabdus cannonii]